GSAQLCRCAGLCRAAFARRRWVRQAGGEASPRRGARGSLAAWGTGRSRRARRPRSRRAPARSSPGAVMRKELLGLAAELSQRGEPFVVAMVVRRESYSSAQLGDMAIITADGGYHGWLGGSCTRPSVQREAARALADGAPRLVSLSPEPDPRPGVTPLPMTCHSGGRVDIYIQPVLPAPRLVLFGLTPVARALAQLGKAMGYSVDVAAREAHAVDFPHADRVFSDLGAAELHAPGPAPYAVVASMGENDEDAVAAALATRPAYVGVVASRRRFAVLRETLLGRGVAPPALDAIKH